MHGNTDAAERLQALSQPTPQIISREEHENIADAKLVRTRTQAKQRSDASGLNTQSSPSREEGSQIIALARKNSRMTHAGSASYAAGPADPTNMAGIGRGGGPQAQGQRFNNFSPGRGPSRLPPVQDHHRGPSATLPLAQPITPVQPRPHPANTLPPSQPAQQFAGAIRYSLVDPGGGSATGPRPPSQPQTMPPGRPGMPRNQSRPPAGSPVHEESPNPPPSRGPQTFEEMGFRSQKLEEKECVIM